MELLVVSGDRAVTTEETLEAKLYYWETTSPVDDRPPEVLAQEDLSESAGVTIRTVPKGAKHRR
jgi:hypothetical protein